MEIVTQMTVLQQQLLFESTDKFELTLKMNKDT